MSRRIQCRAVRCGSALVLLIVLLPVVLAVCAYVINVVYMELARTELQISTDVATRAAGRTLAVTGSEFQARLAADRMLKLNSFVNQSLTAGDAKITFGASTRTAEAERYSFEPDSSPNAVSVSAGGKIKVPMLFPTMGVPIDFRPLKTAISTQSELDIVIVLDRSGSMAFNANEAAGNYKPIFAPWGWQFGMAVPPLARWLDAVNSVDSFVSYLDSTSHDEHLALVTYSDTASKDCGLSSNYGALQLALTNFSLKFNGGATNIADGILFGAEMLSDKKKARTWASRVLIVLTDGNWTAGSDPKIAAAVAASQNILIYTITFSDEADQASMAAIATIGKGQHFHASNGAELTTAFKNIAKSLPTLLTD